MRPYRRSRAATVSVTSCSAPGAEPFSAESRRMNPPWPRRTVMTRNRSSLSGRAITSPASRSPGLTSSSTIRTLAGRVTDVIPEENFRYRESERRLTEFRGGYRCRVRAGHGSAGPARTRRRWRGSEPGAESDLGERLVGVLADAVERPGADPQDQPAKVVRVVLDLGAEEALRGAFGPQQFLGVVEVLPGFRDRPRGVVV